MFRLFIIFSFVSRYFRSVVRPYYDNIRFGRWVICPPPNGFVLVRFRSPRAIFPPFLLFFPSSMAFRLAGEAKEHPVPEWRYSCNLLLSFIFRTPKHVFTAPFFFPFFFSPPMFRVSFAPVI